MFIKLLSFTMFVIVSLSTNAKVYKCDVDGVSSFSSKPCENSSINLDLDDKLSDHYFSPAEHFVVPVYPDWEKGWKKTKDFKLERYSEIAYQPQLITKSNKSMSINQQKLTDIPQSMNVKRFSKSVDDILESLCNNTLFIHSKIDGKYADRVVYGQYACSYRRDTQQGEMGHYKIMRGENSIYMMTVKWDIEPFNPDQSDIFELIKLQQQAKFTSAQHYLQKEVQLCRDGECL